MWTGLNAAIRQTWPDAIVAPYLTIGATDARHYVGLSEHIYGFSPTRMTGEDLDGIHGDDERISIDNLEHAVGCSVRLVHALCGEGPPRCGDDGGVSARWRPGPR